MKVFLGLHRDVDGHWTPTGNFITEKQGIVCRVDDGRSIAVTHDGRVLTFNADGHLLTDTDPEGRFLIGPAPKGGPSGGCTI